MDYNFFEGSEKTKGKSNKTVTIVMIIIIVLVSVTLGSITLLNIINTNKIKTEMNAAKIKIKENEGKIEELAKKEQLMKDMSQTVKFFEALNRAAVNSRTVNTDIMDYIASEQFPVEVTNGIPNGLSLQRMEISNRLVRVSGKSLDQLTIAKFQENLRAVKVKDTNINVFTNIEVVKIEVDDSSSSPEPAFEFDMHLYINSLNGDAPLASLDNSTLNSVAINDNNKEVSAQ